MAIPRIAWEQVSSRACSVVEALTGPVLSATTVGPGQNSAVAATLDTPQGRVFVKGLRSGTRSVITQ